MLDRLGAGGMGVVYSAQDLETGRTVALKTLQWRDGEEMLKLKREFRALADLAHPNLVALYELVASEAGVFFTMEQVQGRPFVAQARMSVGPDGRSLSPVGYDALRGLVRQLVEGVDALHAAGRLHRDIKPSNVLVSREGRVVLLDFGVAMALRGPTADPGEPTRKRVVGTIAYMSPEQSWAGEVGPPADWYALGVMLYEALTGEKPFSGTLVEVLAAKEALQIPRPIALAPATPPELDRLVMRLLDPAAERRPSAADILLAIGVSTLGLRTVGATQEGPVEPFFGRDAERARLAAILAAVGPGRPAVVGLSGAPGMGRTALVDHFLGEVRKDVALVLSGRCHPSEDLPFKAVDGLVDALSRRLIDLDPERRRPLVSDLPPDLARLFPVLAGVPGLPWPEEDTEDADAQADAASRDRALGGLRRLLERLSAGRPLVLWIDDLQWGDLDSARVLQALLSGPDALPILLILSWPDSDADAPPVLALAEGAPGMPALTHARLHVGPLAPAAAQALAELWVGRSAGAQIGAIVAESAGSPLVTAELARALRRNPGGGVPSLPQALARRIAELPAPQRRLLDVIAVAGHPGARRGGTGRGGGRHRGQHAGPGQRASAAPHPQGPGGGRPSARRRGRLDRPERGGHPRAARPAGRGPALACGGAGGVAGRPCGPFWPARRGAALWSCRRSAPGRPGLPPRGQPLWPRRRPAADGGPERWRLLDAKGEAEARAGRSGESARCRAEAANLLATLQPDHPRILDMRRLAAEQYLRGGRVEDGQRELAKVLNGVGLKLPQDADHALRRLIFDRLRLRVRGLRFRPRPEADQPAAVLQRVDTCWTAAMGLCWVDSLRSAVFQSRYTLLALATGEPDRVARALATEAAFAANEGGAANRRRSAGALLTARQVLAQVEDPVTHAIVDICDSASAFFSARFRDAVSSAEAAELRLSERGQGASWEQLNAHVFGLWSRAHLGELGLLRAQLPRLIEAARERGDLLTAACLSSGVLGLAWLAEDRPEQARLRADDAMALWVHEAGFHTQHFMNLVARVQLDLYQGEPEAAWLRLEEALPRMKKALMLRLQFVRMEVTWLRGRVAVACLAAGRGPLAPEDLHARAQALARTLSREDLPWGLVLATGLQAGLAAASGDTDGAKSSFEKAISAYDGLDMALHREAARWRLGGLLGGEEGAAARAQAEAWLQERGVVRPERLVAVALP